MVLSTIVVYLIGFALCVALLHRQRRVHRSLPPGPRPLPLLGNLFDFTFKEPWLRVTSEWARQYGNLVYLHLFGQGFLYLNTYEDTVELLEKRGAVYADRPHSVMRSELCGCDDIVRTTRTSSRTALWARVTSRDPQIAFAGYGAPQFRRHSRLLHAALGPASIPAYRPAVTTEVIALLKKLLDSPENYVQHIRSYTGDQVMSIVYGYRVTGENDPYMRNVEETLHIISDHIVVSGLKVWLVDLFPALKHLPTWFPGMGFKTKAAGWKAKIEECANGPFEWVRDKMRAGAATPCYCSKLLSDAATETDGSVDAQYEDDIKWTAHAMYLASIDTTLVLLTHLILAMVQYPEVARKAQKDIDAVTGTTRLPRHDDRAALPYISAIVSECMRWTAPVPLALPHQSMQDDVYKGMIIPKGTLVFPNIWKMTRDPNLFPDPEAFVPERYLEEGLDDATARKRDPRNLIFGFGRRKCIGTHLVESYLWLAAASMLATFDFAKATDAAGNVVEPRPEYNDASFRLLTPFPCVIRPRSGRATQLVHETLEACV